MLNRLADNCHQHKLGAFLARGWNNYADLLILGRAIRRMREQQGMETDELAVATGISRDRIEALGSGHLDPTYELKGVLAAGLGTQPSRLVTLAKELKETGET